MKHRICEICEGKETNLLFRQSFSPIDGASLFDGYNVVVCRTCGFAFADDIPSQREFDSYYRELSKYEYDQREGRESAFDLARFRIDAAEFLEFIQGPHVQILEIGCSSGGLLATLRDLGFPQVRGLDPSPNCARTAQHLYSIPVTVGTLIDASALDQQFDVVIGIGLLEHVRELRNALAQVRLLLRPGGRVFVEVPDALRFGTYRDSPFQQFSVEHIDFFSPRSLANLMHACGFVSIRMWQAIREHSKGYIMPIVAGVFESTNSGTQPAPPVPDTETEPALAIYIDISGKIETRLHQMIDRLVSEQTPLLVWGVGTHTQRLLATSRLPNANISAFVDSNAKYHERILAGRPIIGPGNLRGRTESIVISSLMFQSEIERQIRDELKLPNDLILLYE